MTAQALSDYIFIGKYSNWNKDFVRRETKAESRKRVGDMHREHYGEKVFGYVDEIEKAMADDVILGSQRVLQYGGQAMLRKHARGFNCTASYCDRPRFFAEAFWLLLCGCGTGFSVQKHHVAKLPEIGKPKGNGSTRTFVVPDTIEGWADALDELLMSYFEPGRGRVVFDYSLIRPEGSPLSTGTGKAPGPDPLRKSLDAIRKLIDLRLDSGKSRLRPIDCYDIVMHASDAVLSGGVRRSASICIFSPDDEEMLNAKTGNWRKDNPQRQNSNNSALLVRGETTFEEFVAIYEKTREWGEPGFYWANSREHMPNPCVEIGFLCYSPVTGETGWGFCNLSSVNVEKTKTVEEFVAACRLAAIAGTLQAGYTNFEYLTAASREIAEHEALLGVSLTGMMRNPNIAFTPLYLEMGARQVMATNEEVAKVIGINFAARATCIKPEGTGSLFVQTTAGIHADKGYRVIRRVTANKNEPHLAHFASVNPHAVEQSMRKETDKYVLFAIEAPPQAKIEADFTAIEFLDLVRLVKRHWVDVTKRPERCLDPDLSHNVSNTVLVRDGEWDDVGRYLYEHRHEFSGVSFLSAMGDLDYAQVPFVVVPTGDEIVDRYGEAALFASGLVVDGIHAYGDLWVACDTAMDGAAGYGVDLDAPTLDANLRALRLDWVRRFRKFADNHFLGDWRETSYCLKHVYVLKQWDELVRKTRDVDYTTMVEEDGTAISIGQTVACAGGVCQVL